MSQRIVLAGFYGAPNTGDEAVCEAIVRGLIHVAPGDPPQITVLTRNAAQSRRFCTVAPRWITAPYPIPKWWKALPRTVSAIARCDTLIIGGGGILQDVHSWTLLCGFLWPAALAIVLRKRVVTAAVGVGPLRRRWLRRLLTKLLNGFAEITVRDDASRDYLERCGIPTDRIHVAADPVTWLVRQLRREASAEAAANPNAASKRTGGEIGLSLRRWPGITISAVAALTDELVTQGNVVRLLPYEPPDREFAESIRNAATAEAAGRIIIHELEKVPDAIATISRLDGLIAMRLHANLFAVGLGVPNVALSYDPKVAAFMGQMELRQFLRDADSVGPQLCGVLREAMDARKARSDETMRRFDAAADRAERMFMRLCSGTTPDISASLRLRALCVVLLLPLLGFASEDYQPHKKGPILWRRMLHRLGLRRNEQ